MSPNSACLLWPPGVRAHLGNVKGHAMRWSVGIAWGLAIGIGAVSVGTGTASAQMPGMPGMQAPPPGASPCDGFVPLRDDAQKKGAALGAAQKNHVDRQEMCKLITAFSAAEGKAALFLEKNRTWCGVPDQAVTSAKEMHVKTEHFREVVCAPAPQPKVPTLSDAMGAPSVDTAKNTKTGAGTFDTLTGNPLAK
jgi:hypothetical protein